MKQRTPGGSNFQHFRIDQSLLASAATILRRALSGALRAGGLRGREGVLVGEVKEVEDDAIKALLGFAGDHAGGAEGRIGEELGVAGEYNSTLADLLGG